METIRAISVTEDSLELPLATEDGGVLTSRGFITGTSGKGKSNTVGVICERILDQGYPMMIIDTEGEYYGLKEKYEILHCGASEECDLQVTVDHAEKLADLALHQNVPIILDVSEYIEEEEANELIKEVAKHLFQKENKLKKPFPLILEEAHNYIPQQGSTTATKILKKIAKQGRKRGLGLIAVSQRPAEVDKGVITQSDWRVWHGFEWDNDIKVAKDVLGTLEVTEDNLEIIEEIMELETLEVKDSVSSADLLKKFKAGQAVLECGFIDTEKSVVQFQRKETFDAGATPTLDDTEQPKLKSVDKELLEELKEVSEQKRKERNRIEELEDKVENLEEELEEKEDELEQAKQISDMAEQFQQSLMTAVSGGSADSDEIQEKVEELKEEKNTKIRMLEKDLSTEKNQVEALQTEVDELEEELEELEELQEYRDMAEELEEKKEMVSEALQRIGEAFDLETGDQPQLRQQLKKKQEKLDKMAEKLENAEKEGLQSVNFGDAQDFLEDELVQKYIQKAVESTTVAEDHFWDTLTYIAREEDATSNELKPFVDVNKSNIGKILKKLEDHKVLDSERDGKEKRYTLNLEGVADIKYLEKRKNQLKQQSQKLKPEQ